LGVGKKYQNLNSEMKNNVIFAALKNCNNNTMETYTIKEKPKKNKVRNNVVYVPHKKGNPANLFGIFKGKISWEKEEDIISRY